MTAEIVDLQKYRRQMTRAEKKSRRAKTGGRKQAATNEAASQEAEAPLPEDALEGEDGSRGGEPV
ncbi:MAG: hypothetical protein IIA35_01265 [Proteobacteria bacterium]|nr:hypothetical protein [Pseudomonadota bacterium]